MVDAVASLNTPLPGTKERRSYSFNVVVASLRDMARKTDVELVDVTAYVRAALEDDGVIDADETQEILLALTRAFEENSGALGVLNLLDESSTEAARREIERLEARGARLKNRRKK